MFGGQKVLPLSKSDNSAYLKQNLTNEFTRYPCSQLIRTCKKALFQTSTLISHDDERVSAEAVWLGHSFQDTIAPLGCTDTMSTFFDRFLALRIWHVRIRVSQPVICTIAAFHMPITRSSFDRCQSRTAQAGINQSTSAPAPTSSTSLTAAGCSMVFPLWVGWPGRDPSAIAISPGAHSDISRNEGPTCFEQSYRS